MYLSSNIDLLFFLMSLPLTSEVNVIIGPIYTSRSVVAFQCYRPGLDADVFFVGVR